MTEQIFDHHAELSGFMIIEKSRRGGVTFMADLLEKLRTQDKDKTDEGLVLVKENDG